MRKPHRWRGCFLRRLKCARTRNNREWQFIRVEIFPQ